MPAPGSNRLARNRATTRTPSEAANATSFATAPLRKISEIAPIAGSRAVRVRIWSTIASSAHPTQDQHRTDQGGTNHHGERVAAHEAVLCPTQPGRKAANRHRCPVHCPIDAVVLQPKQAGCQLLAGPHEDRLVDHVTVKIVATGVDQHRPARRRLLGDSVPGAEDPYG